MDFSSRVNAGFMSVLNSFLEVQSQSESCSPSTKQVYLTKDIINVERRIPTSRRLVKRAMSQVPNLIATLFLKHSFIHSLIHSLY